MTRAKFTVEIDLDAQTVTVVHGHKSAAWRKAFANEIKCAVDDALRAWALGNYVGGYQADAPGGPLLPGYLAEDAAGNTVRCLN